MTASHPISSPLSLAPPGFVERPSDLEQLKQAEPGSRRSFNIGDWFPGDSQSWKRPLSRNSGSKYRRRHGSPAASPIFSEDRSATNETPQPSTVRRNVADYIQSYSEEVGFSPSLSQHDSQPAGSRSASHIPNYLDISPNVDYAVVPDFDRTPDKESLFDLDSAKAMRSSPGRRGPSIDTIFQESPPPQTHGRHTLLRDILQHGPYQDQGQGLRPRHSIIHEEDGTTTPARSVRQIPAVASSAVHNTTTTDMLPSSPPEMPSLLHLRHKENFDDADDDGDQESSWSFGADDDADQIHPGGRFAHLGISSGLLNPPSQPSSSATATPQRGGPRQSDRDTRSSIFDWSEQQPFDRSPGTHSPPRPKTVHGKKDADSRGSRSVGRRAPSGVHARSQSVPVAQEADGTRIQVVTNKFGTWGVGSKGVTEDWNEDFDFGDVQAALPVVHTGEEKRLDSGIGMLVPQAIREQQTNVLANIGLVRDWGLLIEEIKELRMRASTLDILRPSEEPTWREVEAMIDLADQESEEHTLAPGPSPPSSPSLNYDDFEDPITTASTRRLSAQGSPQPRGTENSTPSSPPRIDQEIRITPATPRRPRKDSEAIARSVIEALQQKRIASDLGATVNERLEKVHFDTATLRRIIPYVQDLRDRVKGILREAEGLYASPPTQNGFGEDTKFGSIALDAPNSPSLSRRQRRSMDTSDEIMPGDGFYSPTEESAARLRLMTVV